MLGGEALTIKWILEQLGRIEHTVNYVRILGRMFGLLTVCFIAVIILVGLLIQLQNKTTRAPSSSMKGFASSVSNSMFMEMIKMEIPGLPENNTESKLSKSSIVDFAFRFIIDVNPNDPKSLLAREIPGISNEKTILLYGGKAGKNEVPVEYAPKPEILTQKITSSVEKPSNSNSLESLNESLTQEEPMIKRADVLIYHSHNRESWLTELKNVKDPDLAFDPQKNITLLGARISDNLRNAGINTVHSAKDYPSIINNFKYPRSYQYSNTTVKEAFKNYPDLKFLFDIHRDSQTRSKTTVTIKNQNYAQVYFVIEKNTNWESNMQFAKKIHNQLNKTYPGISKGIYSKSSNGNGEYNQSLSPNSSLIEIGGVENTIEESYRTADILSGIIAELYMEAEKVSAPIAAPMS